MSRDGKSASLKTGYIYAFLCSLFSALMIVLIKKAEETLPVLSVLLVMQVMAGSMLTAALLAGGRLRMLRETGRAGWKWIGVIAVLTFFAYWTFFTALDLLDPTVASFLGRAETLVTISFGVIFLSERFLRGEIAGAALVLGGAAVIRSAGGVDLSQGFFLCMLSALIWGVTEGLAKMAIRTVEPFVLTWARAVLLVPAFLAAAAASPEGIVLPDTPDVWFTVIALALAGPVLARLLYLKSLTVLPVSKVALVNQFQPVGVAVLAVILFGTLPALREWIGGALIIAGCLLLVGFHAWSNGSRRDQRYLS